MNNIKKLEITISVEGGHAYIQVGRFLMDPEGEDTMYTLVVELEAEERECIIGSKRRLASNVGDSIPTIKGIKIIKK